jgi:hypothetical protein
MPKRPVVESSVAKKAVVVQLDEIHAMCELFENSTPQLISLCSRAEQTLNAFADHNRDRMSSSTLRRIRLSTALTFFYMQLLGEHMCDMKGLLRSDDCGDMRYGFQRRLCRSGLYEADAALYLSVNFWKKTASSGIALANRLKGQHLLKVLIAPALDELQLPVDVDLH